MLVAENLSYDLPTGRRLFGGIDLTVDDGEVIAVVGPSGVGKSTLLSVLGGLLKPTTGTVRIGESDQFAWILQTLNSMSSRSVLDNALLLSLADGEQVRTARERAEASLEAVGLIALHNSKAKHLSGGELQRLAVARSLASSRSILLADEPTNQLDSQNARLVMEQLSKSSTMGRSVVIVTHDLSALPKNVRTLRLTEAGLERT